MSADKKQIECKIVGCNQPHAWYETKPDGTRLICFKTKVNGNQFHIKKYELPPGVRELKAA